jgi:hypothetical protein
MPLYMLRATHQPQECEESFRVWEKTKDQFDVKTNFCTCPHGVHGGFLLVEDESADVLERKGKPFPDTIEIHGPGEYV